MSASVEKMVAESIVRRLRKQIAFREVDPESPEEIFESIVKLVKMSHPEDFMHAFMSVLLIVISETGEGGFVGGVCADGLIDLATERRGILRSTKSSPSRLLCCIQG